MIKRFAFFKKLFGRRQAEGVGAEIEGGLALSKRLLPSVLSALKSEKVVVENLEFKDRLSGEIYKRISGKEAFSVNRAQEENYLRRIKEIMRTAPIFDYTLGWHRFKPPKLSWGEFEKRSKIRPTHKIYISPKQGLENRLRALEIAAKIMDGVESAGGKAEGKSAPQEVQRKDAVIVFIEANKMNLERLRSIVSGAARGRERFLEQEAYPVASQIVSSIPGIGLAKAEPLGSKISHTLFASMQIAEIIAKFVEAHGRKPNELEAKALLQEACWKIAPRCGW